LIHIEFDIRNFRNLRSSSDSRANPALGTFVTLVTSPQDRITLVFNASGKQDAGGIGQIAFSMQDPSGVFVATSGIFTPSAIHTSPPLGAAYIIVPPRWIFGWQVLVAPGIGINVVGSCVILDLLIAGQLRDLEMAGAGG
jgi:hypothetical protein